MHEPQVITSVAAGLRPPIAAGEWDPELVRLTEDCWQDDPQKRPTFEEVMVRLETILRTLGGAEEETKRQILL